MSPSYRCSAKVRCQIAHTSVPSMSSCEMKAALSVSASVTSVASSPEALPCPASDELLVVLIGAGRYVHAPHAGPSGRIPDGWLRAWTGRHQDAYWLWQEREAIAEHPQDRRRSFVEAVRDNENPRQF